VIVADVTVGKSPATADTFWTDIKSFAWWTVFSAAAATAWVELTTMLGLAGRGADLPQRAVAWSVAHWPLIAASAVVLVLVGTSPAVVVVRAAASSRLRALTTAIALYFAAIAVPLMIGADCVATQRLVAVACACGAGLSVAARRRRSVATLRVGLDDPISSPAQDLLRRGPVASEVARVLVGVGVRCPRVALVAPVGAGKSSVANLARHQLEEDGHTVVRFDPWYFPTPEDARRGLVETIDQALVRGGRRLQTLGRSRRWLAAAVRSVIGEHKWAEPLRMPIEAVIDVGKHELSRAIRDVLPPEKRLVVIVEDLERADAAVTAMLLMTTREVLDADGLAFLFAFDVDAVHEKLREAKQLPSGTDQTRTLLDKLFDHVVDLPQADPVTAADFRRAVSGPIGLQSEALQELLGLAEFVPAHPREYKRFVYSLVNGAARISSAPRDLNPRSLVLFALLDFRCPGAIRWLAAKPDRSRDLAIGALVDRMEEQRGRAPAEGPPHPNAPWLSTGADPIARTIYRTLRDTAGLTAERHLDWMLGRTSTAVDAAVEQIRALLADGASEELIVQRLVGTERQESHAVARTLDALQITQAVLIQELQGQASAERADVLVRHVETLVRATSVAARLSPQPAGVPVAAFLRGWNAFCALLGWGGRFVTVADSMFNALCVLCECAGRESVVYLSALHRSDFMPAEENRAAANDLRARLTSALVTTTLDDLLQGKLMERSREAAFDAEFLFRPSELHSSATADVLRERARHVRTGDPGWDDLFKYFGAIAARAKEGDSHAQQILVGRQEFVRVVWDVLTAEPLAEVAVARLRPARQVVATLAGYELPVGDWWDGTLAGMARRWLPLAPQPESTSTGRRDEGEGTPAA